MLSWSRVLELKVSKRVAKWEVMLEGHSMLLERWRIKWVRSQTCARKICSWDFGPLSVDGNWTQDLHKTTCGGFVVWWDCLFGEWTACCCRPWKWWWGMTCCLRVHQSNQKRQFWLDWWWRGRHWSEFGVKHLNRAPKSKLFPWDQSLA